MGDHIPDCLNGIIKSKLEGIAHVAEMSVSKKPLTPSEYWDYVRKRDAEGMGKTE